MLLSFGYAVGLALLMVAFRFHGERSWVLSLLIFLPIWSWALPLLGLIPAASIWHRHSLWALIPCALFFLLGPYGWHWHSSEKPAQEGVKGITLMTYNVGESNGTSLDPFFHQEKPDLLVLQDSWGRRRIGQHLKEGYFYATQGEYSLLSRWPIRKASQVPLPHAPRPIAARFEIDHPEHPFTLYNVHFPTPRPSLIDLFKGPQPWRERLALYRTALQRRVTHYDRFVEIVADEPTPALLVGDFNAPSWGHLHSLFSSRFDDAFSRSGNGFGFTFPAWDPWLPLFYGPWLRLDYIFSAPPWHPVACKVEPERASQHRAVVTTLEWRPQP